MGRAIGIDLGTTFSAVARVDDTGKAVIIPNAEGRPVTPSVIWFGADPPVVGDAAKAEQRAGATDVAAFFKRRMGDLNFRLEFNGRDYSPTDLSALILQKIKADCESYLRDSVSDAVITVPAYFVNAQREATIEAGRRAGLNVLRIINEPTAAALAYGVQKTDKREMVLVYDLGGGTFDVTLVEISPDEIRVRATDGDHELGGKDWDDRIAQFLAVRFRAEHGPDPIEELASFNELLVRCEDAKKKLSSVAAVKVRIEHAGISAEYELTRDQFEEQTGDLMERTQKLTEQVLADAGVHWDDLTGVLPVGGSSQMPMVHRYVERMSGKPPRTGVPVEQAVALGAAIQAAIDSQPRGKDGKRLRIAGEKKVQDVMSHSLGMIAVSPDRSRYLNAILIPKNDPIPSKRKLPFKLRTRPGNNDNTCEVYLTQGETDQPKHCDLLGKYVFSGIAHDKSREVVLEVEYSYDPNGVVQVAAVDPRSGQSLPMKIDQLPSDMSWIEHTPEEQAIPMPVFVYLAIDVSGSMSGGPLEEAKRAARRFLAGLDLSHCSFGIMTVANSVELNLKACQDARAIERAIDELEVGLGYGNSAEPFTDALSLFQGLDGTKFMVVLADGVWSNQHHAIRAAQACHQAGIAVIAVGFGSADYAFLKAVASAEEGAIFAGGEHLVGTFGNIAQAITEYSGEGKVQMDQLRVRG